MSMLLVGKPLKRFIAREDARHLQRRKDLGYRYLEYTVHAGFVFVILKP